MELKTLESNINIFAELKENVKLVVNNDQTVSIDDRYFQGFRRSTDKILSYYPSSRQTTYDVIKDTYEAVNNYPEYKEANRDLINKSLDNLLEKFTIVYPDYPDLLELIKTLKTNSNKQNDVVIDVQSDTDEDKLNTVVQPSDQEIVGAPTIAVTSNEIQPPSDTSDSVLKKLIVKESWISIAKRGFLKCLSSCMCWKKLD
jgi:hypothetical protein